MKQHWSQFPRLLQRLQGEEQFRSQLLRSSKALEVCDALMRLDGEFESGGRCIDPTFQEPFSGETPERIVHFDGVQACGVVTQELAGRQLRRIEIRLPTGICPTRRTGVNFRHRSAVIVSEDLVCFIFSYLTLCNAVDIKQILSLRCDIIGIASASKAESWWISSFISRLSRTTEPRFAAHQSVDCRAHLWFNIQLRWPKQEVFQLRRLRVPCPLRDVRCFLRPDVVIVWPQPRPITIGHSPKVKLMPARYRQLFWWSCPPITRLSLKLLLK